MRGLDEEHEVFTRSEWVMSPLELDESDQLLLQQFDDETINKFNRFDIKLKENFPGLTDLIDYNSGSIMIVKPKYL